MCSPAQPRRSLRLASNRLGRGGETPGERAAAPAVRAGRRAQHKLYMPERLEPGRDVARGPRGEPAVEPGRRRVAAEAAEAAAASPSGAQTWPDRRPLGALRDH